MGTSAPSGSAKTVVLTALISAFSTIAVAFMGVVPLLMKSVGEKPPPTSPRETWNIEGSVARGGTTDEPLSAEVFLVEAPGSDLMAVTDAQGRFVLKNVPPGEYWLVMRDLDSKAKSSGRWLLDKDQALDSLKAPDGTAIRYTVSQRASTNGAS
jgi:hypothetical protein